MNKFHVVGKSLKKNDINDKVLGKAIYADDLNFEGMLYGKVLRSKVPHAILKNIDTSKAKDLPGVHVVLTHEDIPGVNGVGIILKDEPVLVEDKVARIGDPLALVAAETPEIAKEAIKLIDVDLEILPPITSIEEAIKENSVKVHGDTNILNEKHLIKGDIEEGFRQSDIIIEKEYRTGHVAHMFIEPESGVATYKDGVLTVWVCTQNPHFDRGEVARVLDLPRSRVRTIQTVTGGGFGGKLDISVQCSLALLSYYTGKPVKMTYDTVESMTMCSKRHPTIMRYKTGVTKDGKLMALEAEILQDTGAYASYGPGVITRSMVHATGPYEVPHVRIKGVLVYTNNPMAGAMRGFGVPQVAVAHESQMNLLAEAVGISSYEIRKRNVLKAGAYTATMQKLEHSVGIEKTLDAAMEKAKEVLEGWEGFK